MSKAKTNNDILIAIIFWTSIAVIGRLIPHLPNATPMTSLSLLSGALLTRSRALLITLFALFISDLMLGCYYHYPILGSWTLFTYSGFAIVVLIGSKLSYQTTLNRYLITISLISFGYWIWTNFGVWLLSGWYSHTVPGLLLCYEVAVPFLRNALCGDLIWMLTLYCLLRCALSDGQISSHFKLCETKM